MKVSDLREHIVDPTLRYLGLYSKSASDLVLGTAAHESHLGEYLVQVGGPALGIYQIEPATHKDLYDNFLAYRSPMKYLLENLLGHVPDKDAQLVSNLAYSTAVCRLLYYRVKEPLPPEGKPDAYAAYWKQYYNTPKGRGTPAEFSRNYDKFILGR